jgi:putative ABC transport system permease protein
MGQAFIQATRQVWRRRSLSAAVITIMAVSIGSCVAIFSMVKSVLLDDWGYADSDRIAIVWHARQNVPGVVGMSPSDFQSHRSTLTSAESVALVTTRGVNLGTGSTPSRVTCARMTDSMFPLLGVQPSRGRWITAEDDRAGAKVVVLSATLANQLSGEGNALDRDLSLDGIPHRVIGVMPASFAFPPEGIQGLTSAECWLPASFTPMELAIPAFNYVLFARLKPGVPMAQVSAEAHAGAQRIWSTYPAAVQSQVQLTALAVPLAEQALARSRTPLMLFAGAVIGLLLIGCANVSNLMLTAFEARRTELSVRTSLGAPRWTIVGQLLMESVLLSAAGGLGGVAIAAGLLSAMIAANATAFPRLADAHIDPPALMFALACGVISGLAGALLPALKTTRASVELQGAGPRVAARAFGGTLWRRGLIAFELALAVVVLILAGVLFRSVASLNQVETGFEANNLLTFSVSLPEAKYKTREQIAAFAEELLRKLRALPSVTDASLSSAPPIGEATATVVFASSQAATGPEYKPALVHAVSAGYAGTLGLRLQSGRFIEASDASQAMPVAVVNESLAGALSPGGRASGSSFSRIGSAQPITIVGVVADTRQAGPQRPAAPALYVPFAQNDQPTRSLSFAMRTPLPISRLAPGVRRLLAGLDAEVPPFAMKTGAELVNGTIAIQRFNMLVIGVFAAFALILAISGLYAVLAQSVQQARRDFGIRQALGATGGRIARSVVGRALVPAISGVLAGGIAASAAAELIASQLFGVKPNDPITFAASGLLVLTISMLVVTAPALKAARVNLSTLLRHE